MSTVQSTTTRILLVATFSIWIIALMINSLRNSDVIVVDTSNHMYEETLPLSDIRSNITNPGSNYCNAAKNRIFTIGFFACGTTSLHQFFEGNNISSIHCAQNNLFSCMTNNYFHNNSAGVLSYDSNIKYSYVYRDRHRSIFNRGLAPICAKFDLCTRYTHFSDFGIGPISNPNFPQYNMVVYDGNNAKQAFWYSILQKQYPNSKYILNVRPVQDWLQSRWALHTEHQMQHILNQFSSDQNDVFKQWTNDWYQYCCHVIEYFNKRNRNELLVFDIQHDKIQKLIKFLEDDDNSDFHLNPREWKHTKHHRKKHKSMTNVHSLSEIDNLKVKCDINI
eukprot:198350_1